MKFPKNIEKLIQHFNRLPSIGPKTAERLALALLKKRKEDVLDFAKDLENLTKSIIYCTVCHNIAEENPCPICKDPSRDKTKLCIVAKPQELLAIENSGEFSGYYHLLWGYLSALDGTTPDKLKIKELTQRLDRDAEIDEVILAFNLDLEGESTILYLTQLLKDRNIKISRLARGLSTGSELEYMDDLTISNALKWRIQLQ